MRGQALPDARAKAQAPQSPQAKTGKQTGDVGALISVGKGAAD